MAGYDFHETPTTYPNFRANTSNDQHLRLDKVNEIKDYFIAEIKERGTFATVIGAPVGMMS